MNSKHTRIEILNIGPGALCFLSHLKFPVKNGLIVQVNFHQEKVVGQIVWKHQMHGHYTYGMKSFSSNISFLQINNEFKALNVGH